VRSAPQLLHAALGAPAQDDCVAVPAGTMCWVCGGDGCARALPRATAIGETYTDQNKARSWDSQWVCEACVYLRRRNNKPPGLTGNWRNYSVLYDPAGFVCASKGEKPVIRAWLRRAHAAPWFAAVADSGQKHVVLWAPLNLDPRPGRGRVLFEEQLVELGDWSMLDAMTTLLTAGVTKDEFARGEYTARSWAAQRRALEAFLARWGTLHGGGWWALCLYLAQRDEAATAVRVEAEKTERAAKKAAQKTRANRGAESRESKGAGGAAGGRRTRPAAGVPADPAGERAQALGPDPGPAQDRGQDQRGHRGPVEPAAAAPGPVVPEPRQRTLF
jgi:hypothetical protein